MRGTSLAASRFRLSQSGAVGRDLQARDVPDPQKQRSFRSQLLRWTGSAKDGLELMVAPPLIER
ncbi:unnamed protein product [Fusarium graminearum]|nr:unnamed protein product [Fusarium graminearum]